MLQFEDLAVKKLLLFYYVYIFVNKILDWYKPSPPPLWKIPKFKLHFLGELPLERLHWIWWRPGSVLLTHCYSLIYSVIEDPLPQLPSLRCQAQTVRDIGNSFNKNTFLQLRCWFVRGFKTLGGKEGGWGQEYGTFPLIHQLNFANIKKNSN